MGELGKDSCGALQDLRFNLKRRHAEIMLDLQNEHEDFLTARLAQVQKMLSSKMEDLKEELQSSQNDLRNCFEDFERIESKASKLKLIMQKFNLKDESISSDVDAELNTLLLYSNAIDGRTKEIEELKAQLAFFEELTVAPKIEPKIILEPATLASSNYNSLAVENSAVAVRNHVVETETAKYEPVVNPFEFATQQYINQHKADLDKIKGLREKMCKRWLKKIAAAKQNATPVGIRHSLVLQHRLLSIAHQIALAEEV